MAKITILGAGGWGIALALAAYGRGHEVFIWSPFEDEIKTLLGERQQKKLLPGIIIPKEIEITSSIDIAGASALTIMAVPSQAVRETAERLKAVKDPGIIVNVSKGIDALSLNRLSVVIGELLPDARVAVLSGPSHAEEVAREVPTTIVAATEDEDTAVEIQSLLMSRSLRIYTNSDVIGVELGGALKNIIALAAGICDGLGLGDNTKAALMTRGLSEIARLGVAMGAKNQTFAGLAGIGDLIVTCTSVHSRNRRFGQLIGKKLSVSEALLEVGTVEGYFATKIARQLASKNAVEMPITEQCYQVLYENLDPQDAIRNLMGRTGKNEHEVSWLED